MKSLLVLAAFILSVVAMQGCANPESDDATPVATVGSEATPVASEGAPAEGVAAAGLCRDAGPQTPRDISSADGMNAVSFPLAPPVEQMNLCNLHTHTNAEHKGPGFSIFVDDSDQGGFACNGRDSLTASELESVPGAFGGVQPGQTIEVHWVHTTCDATPGEGLGACVPSA